MPFSTLILGTKIPQSLFVFTACNCLPPLPPNPKGEDHPLSTNCDYLLNLFQGTFHMWMSSPSPAN
jgi:hypothetical protein